MSSVTLLLILLTHTISPIISTNPCDLLSAIDLQSATYSHSLILRVRPINIPEELQQNSLTRKVLIREVIKIPSKSYYHQVKINDIILIRIIYNLDEMLDESCWHLFRMENADIILFINQTNTKEFDLRYPPIESTLHVRENINAVMNSETFSPQAIIKTRIDKPILSNDYSLQCNARGNPIPRLLWSKNNQSSEYYPSAKQCQTPCRIYSIQNKYQSILHIQSLTNADGGIYICHAENIINHTMATVYVDIDRSTMNVTCDNFKYCHNRGQCLIVDNRWKCFCDHGYFGEQCETNYDEIITKQNHAFLLFKSRFLTGFILLLLTFVLIFIAFVSFFLAKTHKTNDEKISASKLISYQTKPISQVIEEGNSSDIPKPLASPIIQIVNNRSVSTKESSTTTDDDDNYTTFNGYCLPKQITDDADFESKTNHLIRSEGYLEFYQPDAESGLIRPITTRKDIPKRYAKYVASQNRFLVPRPINQR